MANPDGYDFTFTEGNRLWRKNLRDNNGDGTITPGDGVDLNRNFAVQVGLRQRGLVARPVQRDLPRHRARTRSRRPRRWTASSERVGFEFFINYHSAAELLLYGVGWQVSTPSPDDQIDKALAGDDANPAVPGYDPDISAELYTTNGDTDRHARRRYGTLGFTPEMSTCETVSDADPDDEWLPEDCVSGFIFPDDEELIQAEFAKNIPFALSVATSAARPRTTRSRSSAAPPPDFVVDPFDVSYGTTQPVAVDREAGAARRPMHYRVNGGAHEDGRGRRSGGAASATATPTTTTTPSSAAP